MRMRLGLLQDPAVIERQIQKEVKAAEAARKKSQIPTVQTEAEAKAEEAMTDQEREAARKKVESARKPRIRPLSEAKAIETGANFAAETFIFTVGIGVIIFEQWRQRRKAKNQRDDIREDLEELQVELKTVRTELEEMKAKHPESTTGKILELWKGKAGDQMTERKDQTQKGAPENNISPTSRDASPSEPTPPPNESPESSTAKLLRFWNGNKQMESKAEKSQSEDDHLSGGPTPTQSTSPSAQPATTPSPEKKSDKNR